jgi:hypothetical protein
MAGQWLLQRDPLRTAKAVLCTLPPPPRAGRQETLNPDYCIDCTQPQRPPQCLSPHPMPPPFSQSKLPAWRSYLCGPSPPSTPSNLRRYKSTGHLNIHTRSPCFTFCHPKWLQERIICGIFSHILSPLWIFCFSPRPPPPAPADPPPPILQAVPNRRVDVE